MPQNILDCQNLPCPEPVLQTKKMLAQGDVEQCTVIVDNKAAKENVTRFLQSQGFVVTDAQDGALWHLTGFRQGHVDSVDNVKKTPANVSDAQGKTLVVVTSSVIGSGNDALGEKLMKNFLLTLPEMQHALWRVILLNGGVRLVAEGSSALDALQKLEQSGVSLLVCGTCLEHFSLMDKKRVGQTTNMLDVVTSMELAEKVITL